MSSLTSLSFYHGTIDTRECRELLLSAGSFLIRNGVKEMDLDSTAPAECILTVAFRPDEGTDNKLEYSYKMHTFTRLKSYAVLKESGSYMVQGTKKKFLTIKAMCDYFVDSKSVLPAGGVLVNSVDRQPWQLMLRDIEIPATEVLLGKGSYGKVVKAKLLQKKGGTISIALKSTKEGADETTFTEMYSEARAMRSIKHHHIINLEGVIVEKLPILLAMEYFDGRSLINALTEKKVSNTMRFPVIYGIMRGLCYMHASNYIHRDIAARNVMVSNDCRKVKIIDFGLAKHGKMFSLEIPQKIPVNWLAPEVIESWVFSEKSDVWALAVTCWEVFHDGLVPYTLDADGNKISEQVKAKKASVTRKKAKSKSEKNELPLSKKAHFVPRGFRAIYKDMMSRHFRKRPGLERIIKEVEKNVIPFLPVKVAMEMRRMAEQGPYTVENKTDSPKSDASTTKSSTSSVKSANQESEGEEAEGVPAAQSEPDE